MSILDNYAKLILKVKTMEVNVIHSHLIPHIDLDGASVEFDLGPVSIEMVTSITKQFVDKVGLNFDVEVRGFACTRDLYDRQHIELICSHLTEKGFMVTLDPSRPGKVYISFITESNWNLWKQYLGVETPATV